VTFSDLRRPDGAAPGMATDDRQPGVSEKVEHEKPHVSATSCAACCVKAPCRQVVAGRDGSGVSLLRIVCVAVLALLFFFRYLHGNQLG